MSAQPPFDDAEVGDAVPRPSRPSIHPMYQQPAAAKAAQAPLLDSLPQDAPALDAIPPTSPRQSFPPELPPQTAPTGGWTGVRSTPTPPQMLPPGPGGRPSDVFNQVDTATMPPRDNAGIVDLSAPPPTYASAPSSPQAPPYQRSRVQTPVGSWEEEYSRANSTSVGPRPVPNEMSQRPWNWGAFFLTPLWCASNGAPTIGYLWDFLFLTMLLVAWFFPEPGNRTIALLLFTSCVGVGVFAGIRGNILAWQNRDYNSIGEFDSKQRTWTVAGACADAVIAAVALPFLLLHSPAMSTSTSRQPAGSTTTTQQSPMSQPSTSSTGLIRPIYPPPAPTPRQEPVHAEPFGQYPSNAPQQYPNNAPANPQAPSSTPSNGQFGGPPPAATQPQGGQPSNAPGQTYPGNAPVDNGGQQPGYVNQGQPADQSGQQYQNQNQNGQYQQPPADQPAPAPSTAPEPSTPSTSDYGGPPPPAQ